MINKDYIFKIGDKIIADPNKINNSNWHHEFLADIKEGLIIIRTGPISIDVVRIRDNKVNHPSNQNWIPVIKKVKKFCNLIISPEILLTPKNRFQLILDND